MPHYDAIFILGPQGSGKGTQAKLFAEKLGFYFWEMGKILRDNREAVTVTGEKVGEIIDRGQLLTDEQLLGVAEPLIAKIPRDQGVIFDGLPRRLGQARFLIDFLTSQRRQKIATALLDVPREESLKRLLLRAEAEGRADDTKEAIEYRLDQYKQETVPMLQFLKERTDYFVIDGRPPIPEVTSAIWRTFGLFPLS